MSHVPYPYWLVTICLVHTTQNASLLCQLILYSGLSVSNALVLFDIIALFRTRSLNSMSVLFLSSSTIDVCFFFVLFFIGEHQLLALWPLFKLTSLSDPVNKRTIDNRESESKRLT